MQQPRGLLWGCDQRAHMLMNTGGKIFVALLCIALVPLLLYGVWGFGQQSKIDAAEQAAAMPSPKKATGQPQQAPIMRENLPQAKTATVPKSDLFRPVHPFQDHPALSVSETLDAAKSGSMKAMYQLSRAYRTCATTHYGTDEEIEKKVAALSLAQDDRAKVQSGVDSAQNVSMAATEVQRRKTVRDECKTMPDADIKTWRNWLEKSAALGDANARADFSRTVLDDFKDEQSQQENFTEYSARRDQAFDMLQDSVANGDCSSRILNGFRWVHQDSAQSYIYESLLWKHAISTIADNPQGSAENAQREQSNINALLSNQLAGVPADQRDAADATSDYILSNYCKSF